MSPDTSWSKRRSCMTTESDCARPPRGLEPPLGLRLEFCNDHHSGIGRSCSGSRGFYLRPVPHAAIKNANDACPDGLFALRAHSFGVALRAINLAEDGQVVELRLSPVRGSN
jgi:hypothetical protein